MILVVGFGVIALHHHPLCPASMRCIKSNRNCGRYNQKDNEKAKSKPRNWSQNMCNLSLSVEVFVFVSALIMSFGTVEAI